MVQCEMCGAETGAPKTVKIEGAELQVCGNCADFGTEVGTQEPSSTSTKYSTSGSSSSGSSGSAGGGGGTSTGAGAGGTGGGGGGRGRRDMFDEMEEVAQDYDDRVRTAREAEGLTQEELSDQLNEKASLIRKIERGDVLPSDSVQRKLERALGISLAAGDSPDDDEAEWSGGTATGGTTLGDVVKRKD